MASNEEILAGLAEIVNEETGLATEAVELDVRLRAVDDLSAVDGYVEADARLGWRLSDRLVLSLTGRNLIEDRRVETSDPLRARAFGRSVFGALQVSF